MHASVSEQQIRNRADAWAHFWRESRLLRSNGCRGEPMKKIQDRQMLAWRGDNLLYRPEAHSEELKI